MQSLDCLAATLPKSSMQGGGCLCLCNGGSVHSESNLKTLSQHSWDTHGDDCADGFSLGSGWDKPRKELTHRRPYTRVV